MLDDELELGPRQRRLIELLSEGPHSLEALMLRLGTRSELERKRWADALRRLGVAGAAYEEFGLIYLAADQLHCAA